MANNLQFSLVELHLWEYDSFWPGHPNVQLRQRRHALSAIAATLWDSGLWENWRVKELTGCSISPQNSKYYPGGFTRDFFARNTEELKYSSWRFYYLTQNILFFTSRHLLKTWLWQYYIHPCDKLIDSNDLHYGFGSEFCYTARKEYTSKQLFIKMTSNSGFIF